MNDNMMKNEVKYLREHLREIYQYKSSMKDLTYGMSLELLSRCCIAFDYLQQELQRKDNIIIEVKDIINRMIYMGYCAKTGKGTTATNFMAVGEQSEFGTRAKYILDKIKELEEK